jgi:hypothetical protein
MPRGGCLKRVNISVFKEGLRRELIAATRDMCGLRGK